MKILRVFPTTMKKRGNGFLPVDRYAFIGDPPFETERVCADEVHVSCTFSWDKLEAERLYCAWSQYYEAVRIGGPAYNSLIEPFEPGKYVKPGVTFTSRGCNNKCPWCLVPEREGRLFQYFDFAAGYIVQDNNLLQCERHHVERVFEMLRYQGRAVTFSGGIDSRLVTDWFIEELRTIPINQIFFACDTAESVRALRKALSRVQLPRDKVRCYALLKYDPTETISEATDRMVDIWCAGAMPSPQLYQPPDEFIEYPKEWLTFQRNWSRPAITKKIALQNVGRK